MVLGLEALKLAYSMSWLLELSYRLFYNKEGSESAPLGQDELTVTLKGSSGIPFCLSIKGRRKRAWSR